MGLIFPLATFLRLAEYPNVVVVLSIGSFVSHPHDSVNHCPLGISLGTQ